MYLPEPIILDDFLPAKYADEIEKQCLDPRFTWCYNPSIEMDGTETDQVGFSHVAFVYPNSNVNPYIERELTALFFPITYLLEDKSGIPFNSLIRVRLGLFTRDSSSTSYHLPHVDYRFEHNVALYYVSDSDGPTHIFEERITPEPFDNFAEGIKSPRPSTFTLQTKIEPKKNRVVIFDGLQYHASSSPIHHKHRIALNINFI
jgi:hypothetical protein